jgi:hypothetical protein
MGSTRGGSTSFRSPSLSDFIAIHFPQSSHNSGGYNRSRNNRRRLRCCFVVVVRLDFLTLIFMTSATSSIKRSGKDAIGRLLVNVSAWVKLCHGRALVVAERLAPTLCSLVQRESLAHLPLVITVSGNAASHEHDHHCRHQKHAEL